MGNKVFTPVFQLMPDAHILSIKYHIISIAYMIRTLIIKFGSILDKYSKKKLAEPNNKINKTTLGIIWFIKRTADFFISINRYFK